MNMDRYPRTGTPSAIHGHNQRQILELLWSGGPLSRTQISGRTGMSKTTVGLIISKLAEDGLVRDTGATVTQKRGRLAALVEAEPASGYARCIEVDGGKVRVSITDLAGDIVASHERTGRSRSPATVIKAAQLCADHALAEAGLHGEQVLATVIGSPMTQPDRADDPPRPSTPGGERHTRLHRALAAAFGSEVVVENHTRLTTIGERTAGAARGYDTVACLVADVEISVGIVLEGSLLNGFTESAGRINAMPVAGRRPGGRSSRAPLSTLRQFAGTEAVVGEAIANGLSAVRTVDDVFRLARTGDARALRVVDAEAGLLAFAIASIAAIVDPEIVVLSGAIGSHADVLADPINRALSRLSPLSPRIVAGSLGREAVMIGARAIGVRNARSAILDRHRGAP